MSLELPLHHRATTTTNSLSSTPESSSDLLQRRAEMFFPYLPPFFNGGGGLPSNVSMEENENNGMARSLFQFSLGCLLPVSCRLKPTPSPPIAR